MKAQAQIRPYEARDAPGAADVLRQVFPQPAAVSATAVEHWVSATPERARLRAWVAHTGEEIVAWADAQLKWSTIDEGVCELFIAVAPAHRRRGVGTDLYELAAAHVSEVGAREVSSFVRDDEPHALAFAERRGFVERRRERSWALDLRKVQPKRPADRDGFRAVRLREVRERVEDLFAMYEEAHADMPSDHRLSLQLDEWRRETLENPELDLDASSVVLAGDRPVSLSWLTTDQGARIASSELTGTARDFRGRGLARLAKEASIAWAAEAGLEYLITSNDSTNSPMLALNERLGYEPRTTLIEVAKTL